MLVLKFLKVAEPSEERQITSTILISVSVPIDRSLCPPLTLYCPRSKRIAAGGIVFPRDAGSNVAKKPRGTASDAAKRGTLRVT